MGGFPQLLPHAWDADKIRTCGLSGVQQWSDGVEAPFPNSHTHHVGKAQERPIIREEFVEPG
jgi:hypothetical protein